MAITLNHVNNYSPVKVSPLGGIGQTSSITTTSIPLNQAQIATGKLTIANQFDQVLTVRPADNSCPTVDIKGNLVINGIDLEERLNTIEKVLSIPERDVILERKHPKLKKLYDEYITALGKYRTFESIKGDDDGTT